MGVERRQGRVEGHPGHRGDKGAHERGAGHGVHRQAEEGHQEGGDDGPAADAVDPADNADDEAEEKDAAHRHAVGLALEGEADAPQGALGDAHRGRRVAVARGQRSARRGFAGGGRGRLLFEHVADHLAADVEQHRGGEQLEMARVAQPGHPDDRADEHPRQGAGHHRPDERPDHPPLAPVAVHARGDGDDVVQLVGGAYRRTGVAEHGHLERQEEKGAGHPAHGGEETDGKGDQRRNPGIDGDTGERKEHGNLLRGGPG